MHILKYRQPLVLLGGLACIGGLIMVIFGSTLSGNVENQIRAGVIQSLLMTPTQASSTSFNGSNTSYTITFFNLTNANDVLMGSAPIVVEVPIEHTSQTIRVNFAMNPDDTYSYVEYSLLIPTNPADWDLQIISADVLYAGAVSLAKYEALFQLFFLDSFFSQLETSPFPTILAMPKFLGSMLPSSDSPNFTSFVVDWASGGLQGSGIPLFLQNTDPNVLLQFWNSSSLMSITRFPSQWWASPNVVAAVIGNTMAPFYNYNSTMIAHDMAAIGTWLILTNTSQWFQTQLVSQMSAQCPAMSAATTWADVASLQFSQSCFSKWIDGSLSLAAYNSFLPSPAPPFELQYFLNSSFPSTHILLTLAQSNTFLAVFSVANSGLKFAEAVLAAQKNEFTLVSNYFPTGITLLTGMTFYEYFSALIENEVLKARFQVDVNRGAGLFIQRTAREWLFGYTDLFSPLGNWSGYMTPPTFQTTPTASQLAALLPTRRSVGTFNSAEISGFVTWRGISQFSIMTDVGFACPSLNGPQAQLDPLSFFCKVWEDTEIIQGALSLDQFPIFQEGVAPADHTCWVAELRRSMTLSFNQTVTNKNIVMRRFDIKDSELDSADQFPVSSPEWVRANNYRMTVRGFQNLAVVPIFAGVPHHYFNDVEHAKIHGPEWDLNPILPTFVDVEPLSGVVMNGAKRLQSNLQLDNGTWDGLHSNMYFGGAGSSAYFYPLFWAEESSTISDSDASDFVASVYDNRNKAASATIALVVIGIAITLLGVIILTFVNHLAHQEKPKTEQPYAGTELATVAVAEPPYAGTELATVAEPPYAGTELTTVDKSV